jgi:hypothetical protein
MQHIPSSPTGIGKSALARDVAAVERQLRAERRLRIANTTLFVTTTVAWLAVPGIVAGAVLAVVDAPQEGAPVAAISVAVVGVVVLIALALSARRWQRAVARTTPRPPRPPAPWWHAPLRVGVLGVGAVVVLLWSLLVVVAKQGSDAQVARAVDDIEAHSAAFATDREWLRTSSLYRGMGRAHDAGRVLNSLVPWSHVGAPNITTAGTLHLPEVLPASVEKLDFARAEQRDLHGLDTTWMSTLGAFDHWAIDTAPARNDLASFDVFTAPTPDFLFLQRSAKIRAIAGYLRNDVRGASADIQHLAQLLASTDLLVGTIVAASLLNIDRKLIEADAARAPASDHSWWHGFGADDVQRLRRAAFGSLQFVGVLTPEAHWALLDGSTPFDCVGLQEGLAGMREYRPALREAWAKRYAQADARLVAASARCRFTNLQQVWHEDPRSSPSAGCESPKDADTPRCRRQHLRVLPLLTRSVVLTDLAEPGPFPPFAGYAAQTPP